MGLKEELKLNRPIAMPGHEALLNIYFTSACIKKHAAEFLKKWRITDVQLNVMMMLKYQGMDKGGLSQAELSDMLLVNRANITGLIDRMEKAGLVKRTGMQGDRRYNIVKLTPKAKRLLEKIEPLYAKEVGRVGSVLSKAEQKKLIRLLERVREGVYHGKK